MTGMDFEMSSDRALVTAVLRLRNAGYVDALRGNPVMGDPPNVLCVLTDDEDTKAAVKQIVFRVDSAARPLI
jgi:hypothetical protein